MCFIMLHDYNKFRLYWLILNMKLSLNIILFSIYWAISKCISQPTNMLSDMNIVYAQNSPLKTMNYTLSYQKAFTKKPQICISLNNYELNSIFFQQNILIKVIQTKQDNCNIYVISLLNSRIYKLSIHYLAIENDENFIIFSRQYNNLTTLSNGNGDRSIIITQNHNYSKSIIKSKYFITGFHIETSIDYLISINLMQIKNNWFKIKISTDSSCKLYRINIYFLFYYQYLIERKYWIISNVNKCYEGQNLLNNKMDVIYAKNTVFILGMNYLRGRIGNKNINFGYQMLLINNNQMKISFLNSDLTICYDFIQIATLQPQPLPTSNKVTPIQKPNQNTSNGIDKYITLLIIILISLAFISFTIVVIRLIIRSQCYRKYKIDKTYAMMKKKLSVIGMQQLPSFT